MDFFNYLLPILILILATAILFVLLKNKNTSSADVDSKELEKQLISLTKENEFQASRIEKAEQEFRQRQERERELIKENTALSSHLSSANTKLEALESQLANEEERLKELQEKFNKDFQILANKILQNNSEQFSKTHQKELDDILKPLKEKLKGFEETVERKYDNEQKERSYLKKELEQLLQLNTTLSDQAKNLTNALKGESKTRGNWGELVLERILESSGLVQGEEYLTQYADTNQENKRIQPDVIIKLPDEKHLIVDSKVSLVAYDNYVGEEDESKRKDHLKLHLNSVRNHVKQLSDKNYPSGKQLNSPDFVLLFMPIEPAFSLAAQSDPDLYAYAWERKVVIVSPTTLLATLRTIASVWKNEKFTKNVQEIQEKAGALYDKFVGFLEDMQKIDRSLATARTAYDDAHNKLSDGRGNIVKRIEDIKTLGARSKKEIPGEFKEETE